MKMHTILNKMMFDFVKQVNQSGQFAPFQNLLLQQSTISILHPAITYASQTVVYTFAGFALKKQHKVVIEKDLNANIACSY